jgi:uncharacterized protein (TIGR02466 family)
MIIEQLFATPLATEYLDLDNTAISLYCKNAIEKTMSSKEDFFSKESPVKYQSNFLNLEDPALKLLVEAVTLKANEYYVALGFDPNVSKLKILQAWCSLNNPLNLDLPHCHVQSEFNAVYYPSGGDVYSGTLNLLTTQSVVQHKLEGWRVGRANNGFNSAGWQITPDTGKLVIFPAWVIHCVSKNQTPNDRISIAFDIVVESKNVFNPGSVV